MCRMKMSLKDNPKLAAELQRLVVKLSGLLLPSIRAMSRLPDSISPD